MTLSTPFCRAARRLVAAGCALVALLASAQTAASSSDPIAFDVPAGEAKPRLRQFAAQAGREIVFATDAVNAVQTRAVKGQMTAQQALDLMLAETGLVAAADPKSGAIAVRKANGNGAEAKNAPRAAQNGSARPEKFNLNEDKVLVLDTFEVMGSKLLNMDIKRSRDDAQPYVIFERETIARSGAVNLEDFLKQRLSMNTAAISNNQTSSGIGNMSQINLRGLGTNQTLILVDGHRVSTPFTPFTAGAIAQSDINGIPLAAVERVEVLASTASGIFGGGATGGVINIILRRDYAGAELKATYENTFDTDTAIKRLDFSAGLTLEGGKTNILLTGSWTDSNSLTLQDRHFYQRGVARLQANNPAFFAGATFPPLGYTTNIRSVDGLPLFGPGTAAFTSVPVGYAGSGGVNPLQANAGRYNLALANNAFRQSNAAKTGLRNAPTIESGSLTVRRQMSDNWQLFIDASASNNSSEFPFSDITGSYTVSATAPNNPFGKAIRVTVPITGRDSKLVSSLFDRRAVAGFLFRLPGEWQAEVDYTWNRSRQFTRQPNALTGAEAAAISSGSIDVLRDTNLFPLDLAPYLRSDFFNKPFVTTMQDAVLRASGPLAQFTAGKVTLSGLVEYRSEKISDSFLYNLNSEGSVSYFPDRSQSIKSAYLETKLPLIGTEHPFPFIQELELQLTVRRDEYTVKAVNNAINLAAPTAIVRNTVERTSTDPTLGLRYRPTDDITVRASYGTGFLPPTVNQLVKNTILANLPAGFLIDPRRGNETTGPITAVGGGNPGLRPELSKSLSVGVILTPKVIHGLRLAIDYTQIRKRDNVLPIQGLQFYVDNELLLPAGRITRAPATSGDPFGVGPITSMDTSSVNAAKTLVEAYDFSLDYEYQTKNAGTFSFYAQATRQTHFKTQLISSQPEIENVGVSISNPLKFKANGSLKWRRGAWWAGWNVSYFDSYLISTNAVLQLNQGNGGIIESQGYHDVFVGYSAPKAGQSEKLGARILQGCEIQVGLKNAFDKAPPFSAPQLQGLYSFLGDPRMRTYVISLKRAF